MAEDPTIELEIRPDGTVRFEVSGVPGEGCEELERLIVEALRGEVVDRAHTPEFYANTKTGLGAALKALLSRKT